MSASSPSLSPIRELAPCKGDLLRALRIFNNLSLTEYNVLVQFDHDDIYKTGLAEHHILPMMRPFLESLRAKNMMEFDGQAYKWELTPVGRLALKFIPIRAATVRSPAKPSAKVLEWRGPRNSA